MTARLPRMIAVLAAAAAAVLALLVAVAGPAAAATPPWEPDNVSEVGTIAFYNASGQQITSGRTDTAPFAAYAVGSASPRSTDRQAQILFANPDPNNAISTWYSEPAGLFSPYPVTQGPASITALGADHPVVTGASVDQTLDGFESDSVISTQSGYQNVVQVRLRTASSASQITQTYDVADLAIDPTTHMWSQIYPAVGPTAPGAPSGVRATFDDQKSTVSWSAPANDGGESITSYVVQQSTDGGATWQAATTSPATVTGTSTTVTGLVDGRSYVFRVAAVNSVSQGAWSAASSAVVPQAYGTYTSLATPARVMDTRSSIGTSPPAARGTVHLQIAGKGGVPTTGASAVVFNVTVLNPAANGYVTAYADTATRPGTSNLSYYKGTTVANEVVAPIGSNGKIAFYNGSDATETIVSDVIGYYRSGTPTAAGAYRSVTPSRVLDTRSSVGAAEPAARGTAHLQILGKGGVPSSGVAAVLMNVNALNPASSGYVTVYADTSTRPGTSNLSYYTPRTSANVVVAPVGSNGKIAFYNGSNSPLNITADVAGYYLAGTASTYGAYVPVDPARILDTRTSIGAPEPAGRATAHLQVTGHGGVPTSGVSALQFNVNAMTPASNGYITVYADTSARPGISSLSYLTGRTTPNSVVTQIGTNGKVAFYNGSDHPLNIVGDLYGYFLGVRS